MAANIFIDSQNLYFESKSRNLKIDFLKLKHLLQSYYGEDASIYIYLVSSPDLDVSKFKGFLKSLGYIVRLKTGKHINHNINIAIDTIEGLDHSDVFVYLSGDGQFCDLYRHLKNKNKRVEVWSYKDATSKYVWKYTDILRILDNEQIYLT